MKVLFILENTIADLHGGTEVSSYHLARLLRLKGLDVEEWSPFVSRKSPFWYTNIISVIWINILLIIKLATKRADLLHIQGKYLLPSGVIVGKLLGIPIVATIRDYTVICPVGLCLSDDFPDTSGHSFWKYLAKEVPKFFSIYHPADSLIIRIIRLIFLIRGWFVTKSLRFWLRQADAVVAVSKHVQKVLEEIGIKSRVIYNSFDVKILTELKGSTLPQGRTLSEKQLISILFVGKLSYGKGYDLFVSLSKMKEFSKYKFVTVGGKSQLPYLDTLKKIKNGLVVIVPSRWPEPFCRVALEALMLGIPVVATSRGGLPEIIEHESIGYLCQPEIKSLAAAMRRAISRNREMRDNIRNHVTKLKYRFVTIPVQQHLTLYRQLVGAED